jgi:hypothetical protein
MTGRLSILILTVMQWWLANWSAALAKDPTERIASTGMRFSILSPVSDSFQKETVAAAKTIPPHIWLAVEKAGWRIRMAEFVVDAEPTLIHVRPRGWPTDMTWQNTDAVHFPDERLLVLAEKRRNRKGQVVVASRVAGVFRHELGHAFDMAAGGKLGFRSAAPEFRNAYLADIQRMAGDRAIQLAYYRQASDAGRQEAFAEAFGILLGGGSDVTKGEIFQASFTNVIAHVRQIVEQGQ